MDTKSDRKAEIEKQVKEGQQRQEQAVAETNARLSGAKPTPTPAEIDSARLGHHVMEKEDDGSGPDTGAPHQRVITGGATGNYQTRDMGAGANRQSQAAPVHQPKPAEKHDDKK